MKEYKIECFHLGILIFSEVNSNINKIEALYEVMPNLTILIGDKDFKEIKFKITEIK